ncbi:PREDICTED: uncharacterized protein LOC108578689 [Habropoda laboriosa]|uniref:uncharacterized protein LOC108578689 n=1 Tax=Habropoda laboriosa TaxID=597456 RepID=UPI00083E58D6|nr:PREDICTED: uncharacterized protein LOC108578689 [Habropoda laboriosa]
MNRSKWNLFSLVMLSLISTGIQSPSKENTEHRPRKRHVSMSSQSVNGPPYWEHILREFVFKTVSPPPQGNHQLYKRLLDAPFYAGPFPFPTTDSATVLVLSRGDVYHLANGHWLFCQQGCFDCEVCSEHTHPAVKWILRRIKRISSHGSPRHDLQLTILPQVDGSYHMKSLWPRSYVYVTSQGEQDAYFNDRRYYRNDGTAYANHTEDDSSGQGRTGRNFWTFVDRNSLSDRSAVGTQVPEKRVIGGNDSSDSSKEHVDNNNKENVESTSVRSKKDDEEVTGNDLKNVKRQPTEVKLKEGEATNGSTVDNKFKENRSNRVRQLIPKLILGTDHLGQKHLVHVVPADASTNTSLVNSAVSNGLNSAGQNRTAYQRILRRIYDSLSSNRRSIESFLDPSKQAGQVNQQSEEHQQQETRSGLAGLKQTGRFYPIHDRGARNKSSLYERWPYTLNWSRQRDKSNDDVFPERFINNTSNIGHRLSNPGIQNNLANLTLHRDMRNKNASDRIRSKLIDNDSLKMGNVTRKFIPRKYKIVVTTESTTKLSDITNDREIIQNRGYLTPGNQNVTSR